MTLKIHTYIFIEKDAFKELIFRVGSGTFCRSSRIRIRIQNSEQNGIRIQKNSFGSTTLPRGASRRGTIGFVSV
jgi:hypothetical protein